MTTTTRTPTTTTTTPTTTTRTTTAATTTTATTKQTTTLYKQALGPRSLYKPPLVFTLEGTNEHWVQETKIIHQVPFLSAGPDSVDLAAPTLDP